MAEIFHFKPKAQLDAQENLKLFIEQCKTKLTVFGADLDWDNWWWPKAGKFSKLGTHGDRSTNEANRLDDELIDFAKAYFRYQQGHNKTDVKHELNAIRAVERALLENGKSANILNLSIDILDQAAQIVRDHFKSQRVKYDAGRALETLAEFVSQNNLISQDLSDWKQPFSRGIDRRQTGLKAKQEREKKLPSEEALDALAEIFANNPHDPKDIFTSSTFALLMCAPSRITEVLELPVDCEIEQLDSKGKLRYGWRFYSGKGYEGDIKWVLKEMVDIAKEAISRIKRLTEESRKLAKWVENNPDRFYRHKNCPDVDDNQPLSVVQACQALGLAPDNKHSAQSALGNMRLPNKDGENTLNSLWKYVMSRQPNDFPWLSKEKGIKYSNALFCMTRNLTGLQRGTSPVILWKPTNNTFNDDLSPRETAKHDHQSIFDRYGYLKQNGERIKLTSHQARHLLDTIAERGGLSQTEIAKWSGRADVKQNRVYNHMSEYEMVAMAEQLDTSLTLFGPAGEVGKHIPITIQEINTLEKGALHVTEFGVCVHDFIISPCEKYRDCLNCSEQVCIKGETEKLSRIKKRFKEVQEQYFAAEKAMQDGFAGADRWYEYHKNTLTRLNELVSILENPEIEDGALIKLKNDKAFSPLRRAVESKLTSKNKIEKEETQLLEDMALLLGGGLG
jgi:hypothetical protein